MSQFLGPVHHRMFEKIRALDLRTDQLLTGHAALVTEVDTACGRLAEGSLEEIIDTDNIHGWLAGQVAVAECRHAHAVHALLAAGEDPEHLKQKQQAAPSDCGADLKQAFFLLDGCFLDGMPCDHAMRAQENEDGTLEVVIDEKAHAAFWNLGTPVEVYEELRFDAMEKQAKACGLKIQRRAPFHYLLGREV